MIGLVGSVVGFFLMLGLMAVGIHVAVVLLGLAVIGELIYMGPGPLASYGNQLWSIMNDFLMSSIPLFVLLGELLLRSGVTHRMYHTLSLWLSGLPGGLLHTNIATSGVFAAMSGSSVATAATISTVALPEFRKRRYNESLVLGTIAAGATLGILIPPSVNMIMFGAITNTSIGKLFVAGMIPGVLLMLCFMVAIGVIAKARPNTTETVVFEASLGEKIASLRHLIGPLTVFGVTMGSIYFGWATPTEAAGVGVVISLCIAAVYKQLSVQMLHDAFLSTMTTSALCFFIITGAFYLNFVVGVLGIPQALSHLVAELGTTKLILILALIVFYFILGCFMETMSMMVGTLPIVFPLIVSVGIDPVWFGVFLVIMMEISLITPPIGMNLFVVQGVRGHGSVSDLFYGVAPFVLVMLVFVGIIILFPSMVTWLPDKMF